MRVHVWLSHALSLAAGVAIGLAIVSFPRTSVSESHDHTVAHPAVSPRGQESATQDSVTVDLSLLASIPARRLKALRLAKPASRDSTPDILRRKETYYSTLESIIGELRITYYRHDQFPTNLCDGLTQHSVVLAGVRYPFYPSTGCSAYESILADVRIGLCEDLIVRIASNVCDAATENGVTLVGPPAFPFTQWKKLWETN